MDRRLFLYVNSRALAVLGASAALPHLAHAGLLDLSNADAVSGLRAALERGAGSAVGKLGVLDGFWANGKVRIALPGVLQDVAKVGKALGYGKRIDELHLSMNRAAEQAVPQAKSLLTSAVKSMSVTDAKQIIGGGDTSVTEFFKAKTEKPLFEKFLPIVTGVVGKVGLAQKYNDLATKLPVKGEATRIENYVTQQSLGGLFFMIGEEERAIRRDPVSTGSSILRRVFGGLK
jgi:hypothetical protein